MTGSGESRGMGARQLAERYNLAELLRGMGVNLPGDGKGLAWGNVYKQIADMLATGGNPFVLMAAAADGVIGAAGATAPQAEETLPPWPGDTSVWVKASQPGKLKLRFACYEALPSSGDGAPPTTSSDTIDLWAVWIEVAKKAWHFYGIDPQRLIRSPAVVRQLRAARRDKPGIFHAPL